MGSCVNCSSKLGILVMSVIFWAAAGGLLFVSSWVYSQYHHFEQLPQAGYTLIPATVLMGVGVLLIILGCVGCIGAFKEQKCLLACFFTVMMVITLGVLTAGVLGYIFRREINLGFKKNVQDGLDKYGQSNETIWTNQIDFWQQELKCCGMHNYTDWEMTPWGKSHSNISYPASCCVHKECLYNHNDTALYEVGCYDKLKNHFLTNLAVVIGVAVAFAVVQILGMCCSCILICRKRPEEYPYHGLPNDGLRV